MECDTQLMKSGCTTHASSESSSSSWNSKRRRPTLTLSSSSGIGGGDRVEQQQHLNPNPNPSNPPKRRKLVRPTFDKPSPSCNADDKGVSRNDGLFQMAAASVPTIPDLTVALDRGGGDQHAEASSKGGLRNDGLFQIAASVPATPDLASFNCNNNKGGLRDGAPLMNMVVTAAPQDTITPDQQAATSVKDKGSRDDALYPPVPHTVLPTPDNNTITVPPEQQQPLLVSTHHCDSKLRCDPVPMAAADATSSGEEIAPLLVLHNTAIQELCSRAILSMRAVGVGVGVPSTCAPLSPEPEPKTETFTHAQRNSCIISQSDHQSSDDLTRAIEEEYAARFPPLLFDDEDDLMLSNIDSGSDIDDDDAFIQRLHAMFHPTSS